MEGPDDDRTLGHLASWFDVQGYRSRDLGLYVGGEFGDGTHECALEPLLAHEDLIDTSRVNGEGHQGQFTPEATLQQHRQHGPRHLWGLHPRRG
jgi:hypothetical protein